MLYNFLNFVFPYAGISMGIGAVLLIVANILYAINIDKEPKGEKVLDIIFFIAEILYCIGIVFAASIIPVQTGSIGDIIGYMIGSGLILIMLMLLLHCALGDNDLYFKVALIPLVLYLICSITFSILLYPDYKITKTTEENVIISQETKPITTFNDIPLASVSGNMEMAFAFGSGNISTSDYVSYWYVDEHGDVLYDKALAYDSVKKPQEDGNYHVTLTTYATVTKLSTIHEKYDDEYSNERTVAVFYLPPALVNTLGN